MNNPLKVFFFLDESAGIFVASKTTFYEKTSHTVDSNGVAVCHLV